MKKLFTIFFIIFFYTIFFVGKLFAQPANDACANAIALTVNGPLLCSQSLDNASVQAGECQNNYAGGSPESVWYRFTATNSTMILNFLQTTLGTFPATVRVYGPYSPSGGCIPACAAAIYNQIQSGDPGSYITLSGLTTTGNNSYLIQIEDGDPNGPSVSGRRFCIGIYTPATNNTVNSSSVISQCGTTYNGTTQGGYSPSGTGTGFRNLDNNLTTTCPACSGQPGADIPFVINNDSWFSFCTVNAGTWEVTFNVGTCLFSGSNSGAQMALFTGSPTALTWHSQASNPTYAGGSWTSPTITLPAGGCAYMVVDGFAGDACTYSYTLTNLSGGCILLPIELLSFNYLKEGNNINIQWKTATERNNDFFTLEKSRDGLNFEFFQYIKGAGTSNMPLEYNTIDEKPFDGITYYRLKQTDYDGTSEYIGTIAVKTNKAIDNVSIVPNPVLNNAEVNFNSISNGITFIQVFDITGKQVYTETITSSEGSNRFVLNTDIYNKGIYFLVISNEFGTEKLKFVKE